MSKNIVTRPARLSPRRKKRKSPISTGIAQHEVPDHISTMPPTAEGESVRRVRSRYLEKKREKKRRKLETVHTQAHNAVDERSGVVFETVGDGPDGRIVESDTVHHDHESTPFSESCQLSNSVKNMKLLTPRNARSRPNSLPAPVIATDRPAITRVNENRSLDDSPTTAIIRSLSSHLEPKVSPASRTDKRSVARMLHLLQSRAARLQTQIDAFEGGLGKARTKVQTCTSDQDLGTMKTLNVRIEMLEEILSLVSEHWYDIFVLEHALRDAVNEKSRIPKDHLERDFEKLVRAYDAKLWGAMVKGCQETVNKTLQEINEDYWEGRGFLKDCSILQHISQSAWMN